MKNKLFLLCMLLISIHLSAQNKLTEYEYWFDNDYSAKIKIQITPATTYQWQSAIPCERLSAGLHTFNTRFKDQQGQYTPVISQYFQKFPEIPQGNKIVLYEYWTDNDYQQRTTQAVSSGDYALTAAIDFKAVPAGLHTFNTRFKDSSGQWSATVSQYFQKFPEMKENKIVLYEYWINDDYVHKFSATINNQQTFMLLDSVNVSSANKALNSLHYRFKDNAGNWSSVLTKTFYRPMNLIVSLNYTRSVLSGETPVQENYYPDYAHVLYELFNITKNKIINTEISYPYIALDSLAEVGDKISIKAISPADKFKPVIDTLVLINEIEQPVTINITQYGYIKATYANSDNAANVGIVYNSAGNFVKKYPYYNQLLTTDELPDGIYTLVSMAENEFYNTIQRLSEFVATGLIQGSNYASQTIAVNNGVISEINVPDIPAFNANALIYTGGNTSFTVNKTQIAIGNYVTLRGEIDFADAYSGRVSNMKLIVDIPEQCSFTANSVMIGNNVFNGYSINNNQLIVPLAHNAGAVRFCVIPTESGTYAPNGFVEFTLSGETKRQPIGTVTFTAEGLNIIVPSVTAQDIIPVRGVSTPRSLVKIYDNGEFIGQTIALANGTWSKQCALHKPYAFSIHNINAEINTPAGLTMQTETKEVTHNITAIQVSKVTMYNTAHPATSLELVEYVTEFDFLNPPEKGDTYWFWPQYPDFTFKIEFTTGDSALVHNVSLNVLTSNGSVVTLPTQYNGNQHIWVATGSFPNTGSLPVNVDVEFESDGGEPVMDIRYLEEWYEYPNKIIREYVTQTNLIDSIDILLNIEVENNEIDTEYLDSIRNSLKILFEINNTIIIDSTLLDSLNNLSEVALIEDMQLLYVETEALLQSINEFNFDGILNASLFDTFEGIHITTCENYVENEMINQGFIAYQTTNSYNVYYKATEEENIIVDFVKNICFVVSRESDLFFSINNIQRSSSITNTIDGIIETITLINDKLSSINDLIDKCKKGLNSYLSDLIKNKNLLERQENSIRTKLFAYERKVNNYRQNWQYKQLQKEYSKLISKEATIYKKIKVVTTIQKAFGTINFIGDAYKSCKIIYGYSNLWASIPSSCDSQADEIIQIKVDIVSNGILMSGYYLARCVLDLVTIEGIGASVVAAPETLGASLIGVAGCIGMMVLFHYADKFVDDSNLAKQSEIAKRISKLRCKTYELPNVPPPFPPNANVVQDPSGFVYEAVPSNYLSGVTTTVFQKVYEENMYGEIEEHIVQWNAAEYAQENPLVTNEYGMYGWDVPEGEWQVKYEKSGYQTVYSDWLPVPPPQLDINVGMVQIAEPNVKQAHGYENSIEIEFSKFMRPALLPSNISVTRNGTAENGTLQLLNEESNPLNATETFVSKVRFTPNTPFNINDVIMLKVLRNVQSYSGTPMAADYLQRVYIKREIQSIVTDSVVSVSLNNSVPLNVFVTPADVSVGKKIMARSVSSSIATVTKEVIVNNNGQATLQISGELPGKTIVYLSVDSTDLKAQIEVNVKMPVWVSSITLDKDSLTLEIGKTGILKAVILPVDASNQNIMWSSSNNDVASVSEGIVTAVSQGTVVITATSAEGNKTANCEVMVINPTGIEEIFRNSLGITLYPNPAKGYVTIKGATGKNVELYDNLGRCILNQKIITDTQNISLYSLTKGIYFVKITENGEHLGTVKLLKE